MSLAKLGQAVLISSGECLSSRLRHCSWRHGSPGLKILGMVHACTMSDLPVWIGGSAEAISAATALWLGIRYARHESAAAWPQLLAEVSGLSPEEINEAVVQNPVVAEIIGIAWEEAARTAAE